MSRTLHRPQKAEIWKGGKGGSRSLGSSGLVKAENFPLGKNRAEISKAKLPTAAPSPHLRTGGDSDLGALALWVRTIPQVVILAFNEPIAQGELVYAERR